MKRLVFVLCLLLVLSQGAFADGLLNGDGVLYRDNLQDGNTNLSNENKLGEFTVRMTKDKLYAFHKQTNQVLTGDIFVFDKVTYVILISPSEKAVAVYYGIVRRGKVSGTWFNLVTNQGGDFELRVKD